jgi:hypothetical protein
MRQDDPLEMWLYFGELPPDRIKMMRIAVASARSRRSREQSTEAVPQDFHQLQDDYRRELEEAGTGTTSIQEALLNLIGITADVRSIPFWQEILEYRRPRDKFAGRRKTYALAALAYLALRHNSAQAYKVLRELTRHRLPDIRETAVEYLGLAYLAAERSLPPDVVEHVTTIATEDPAFGPRFQARMLLHQIEAPVPLDNPGGVYVFKVKFMWAKRINRTIAVRSEQTLMDLHHAIQRAIKWDDDHLYAFFMSGKVHDARTEIGHPYLEDVPLYVDELTIGELGLVRKHKFVYFFDFGDSHQFEVEVLDIHPKAERRNYPVLLDKQGASPRQYHAFDEDEEEDDTD